VRRLGRLLDRAWPLLTEAEQGQVSEALERLSEVEGGPYAIWLRDLRNGRCRLPDLPAAVMKELLLAWLSPEAEGGMVCQGCGLEYPRHEAPPLSAAAAARQDAAGGATPVVRPARVVPGMSLL
jgi:hypothetical protein